MTVHTLNEKELRKGYVKRARELKDNWTKLDDLYLVVDPYDIWIYFRLGKVRIKDLCVINGKAVIYQDANTVDAMIHYVEEHKHLGSRYFNTIGKTKEAWSSFLTRCPQYNFYVYSYQYNYKRLVTDFYWDENQTFRYVAENLK